MTYKSVKFKKELQKFKYEILISSNISKKLMYRIGNFWSFKNGQFEYEFEENKSDGLFSSNIISPILSNSRCLLTFPNCLLCQQLITIKVRNRSAFKKWVKIYPRICSTCKEYSPNYNDHIPITEPDRVSLNQLSDDELRILTGIINLKSKTLIYRHIFNNDISNTSIWKVINSLQRKGLIWIERDSSHKIKSFNYSLELLDIVD